MAKIDLGNEGYRDHRGNYYFTKGGKYYKLTDIGVQPYSVKKHDIVEDIRKEHVKLSFLKVEEALGTKSKYAKEIDKLETNIERMQQRLVHIASEMGQIIDLSEEQKEEFSKMREEIHELMGRLKAQSVGSSEWEKSLSKYDQKSSELLEKYLRLKEKQQHNIYGFISVKPDVVEVDSKEYLRGRADTPQKKTRAKRTEKATVDEKAEEEKPAIDEEKPATPKRKITRKKKEPVEKDKASSSVRKFTRKVPEELSPIKSERKSRSTRRKSRSRSRSKSKSSSKSSPSPSPSKRESRSKTKQARSPTPKKRVYKRRA